jgi:hypothetical protein
MTKQGVVLALVLAFLVAGCITQPPEQQAKTADISVVSFEVQNASPLTLGSVFPARIRVESTNPDASYTLHIRLNGEDIYKEVYTSNITKEVMLPATIDGPANLTAVVFLDDTKVFFDNNASNDVYTNAVKILPYGNFTNVVTQTNKTSYYECNNSSTGYCKRDYVLLDVENYTGIYDKRTYGRILHFDSDVNIDSIGIFVRRTFILSPDTAISYQLYPIVNSTPSKESVMGFNTSLIRVPDDWALLLLRRKSGQRTLPAGDYVLEISVDNQSSADVACVYIQNATGITYERTEPLPKRQWYDGPNCLANIIISSRNELETYKEYMAANNITEQTKQ